MARITSAPSRNSCASLPTDKKAQLKTTAATAIPLVRTSITLHPKIHLVRFGDEPGRHSLACTARSVTCGIRNTLPADAGLRAVSGGDCVLLGLAVQLPVHSGVAQHNLHILARLGEWNGLHEFLDFIVVALGFPERQSILTRVIGRGCILGCPGAAREVRDI